MSTAKRTDPKLWDKVKDEITRSSKGGEPGEWSARKAQMAVQEYKKRGGGYVGGKRSDNDLTEWAEEEWNTKSGKKSKDTGERYLPKSARKALSDEDYARTTAKKRKDNAKGKQHSQQPADISAKTARQRHDGGSASAEPTKADLMDVARALGIEGRSKMDKDTLQSAVLGAVKDSEDVSKDDLMTLARAFDVSGRSTMGKADLKRAIAGAAG